MPSSPDLTTRQYLRMLAVIAAPVLGARGDDPPSVPLDVWGEWSRLCKAVERASDAVSGIGAPWAVVRLNPPTRVALGDTLTLACSWERDGVGVQVVHFVGHGSSKGLALENDLGREDFVSTEELVAALQERPVELVVLNACATQTVAEVLHKHAGIPAVIAMCDSLRDDEGKLFAERLYMRLARGQSVGEAFGEAVYSLRAAYKHGELSIPSGQNATTYAEERARIPVLIGDRTLRLTLPPESERAKPLFTLVEPRHNLQFDIIQGFVGRGSELVQLAEWLRERERPVIVISGIGGIGKSALATMAALRSSHRFQTVIAVSAKDNPAAFSVDSIVKQLDAVAKLGGKLAGAATGIARAEHAIAYLNRTPTLLLLDNLEGLSEAQSRALAEFIGRLDPRGGSAAILTLRPAEKHPLTDAAGPYHCRLTSLDPASALRLAADRLREENAWERVELKEIKAWEQDKWRRLARRAWLEWLSLEYVAALDELAEAAGRHPKLLQFALGDLLTRPTWKWTRLLACLRGLQGRDWDERAGDMVGKMLKDLRRKRVEAVTLLQELLVFRGGASEPALRYVHIGAEVGDDDQRAVEFDDLLTAARGASLLEGGVRVDLHPLTRGYLETRARPDPMLLTKWQRRHAEVFLKYAQSTRQDYEAQEAELDNLRAAFAFVTAKETRDDWMVQEFLKAFYFVLEKRGYWDENILWWSEYGKSSERLGDQAGLATTYNNIANVHYARGDYSTALDWYQKSVVIFEKLGYQPGLATTYNNIGEIHHARGDYAPALDWYQKSVVIFERLGHQEGLATTYNNIGFIHQARGDMKKAIEFFEQSLTIFEQLGSIPSAATVRKNLEDARRSVR